MAAEALLVFVVFAAISVGFALWLWQVVQGEGRGETLDRRDAERTARRDLSDAADAADEPSGWGAEARRETDDDPWDR